MPPSSTRARALGLARRLAAGALQRLAREVDRLSLALEPLRAAIPLREPERNERVEVEVTRHATARAPASSVASEAMRASARSEASASEASAPEASAPEAPQASAPAALAEPAPPEAAASAPSPVAMPPAMAQVGRLRERIEPRLARLREASAWDAADDPAEAVRRLRVATRRLRAFVRLFATVIDEPRARKLERRLRRITRALGPLREWDVLLEGLRAHHAEAEPLTRAALEHVTAWAEVRRGKAVRKATRALAEVDAPALADRLDAELDRVCGWLSREDEPLPARASALLEPELRRALDDMPAPRHETDVDALHDVRIRAKRLRYALELLQPALPALHRARRRILERAQASLGEHREAVQLAERLHERREALRARGLHTLADALDPVEAAAAQRRQRAFERAMRALAELEAAWPDTDPAR